MRKRYEKAQTRVQELEERIVLGVSGCATKGGNQHSRKISFKTMVEVSFDHTSTKIQDIASIHRISRRSAWDIPEGGYRHNNDDIVIFDVE